MYLALICHPLYVASVWADYSDAPVFHWEKNVRQRQWTQGIEPQKAESDWLVYTIPFIKFCGPLMTLYRGVGHDVTIIA